MPKRVPRRSTTPTFGKISPSQQEERDRRAAGSSVPVTPAKSFFAQPSFGNITVDEQLIQDLGLQGDFLDVMTAGTLSPGGPGTQLSPMQAFASSPSLQAKVDEATRLGGPPVGGSGGGFIAPIPSPPEGLKKLADIEWKSVEFEVEDGNAPDWWVGKVPSSADDAGRPDVNYLMTLNSMIPYMSPEDQEAAARALYAADADHFSEYKPQKIGGGKQTITKAQSLLSGDFLANPENFNVRDDKYFESKSRARGALNMLNQMRKFTVENNRWKIAPAYTMLQSMLGAMEQYGGGPSRGAQIEQPPETLPGYDPSGGQTPAQLRALMGQLDPLLASTNSPEIGGGFAFIAKLLSQPFFSAGQLNPTQAVEKKLLIGSPNPLLQF